MGFWVGGVVCREDVSTAEFLGPEETKKTRKGFITTAKRDVERKFGTVDPNKNQNHCQEEEDQNASFLHDA